MAGCWWFTPAILATQEAEMKMEVQSNPGQTVWEITSQKYSAQNRTGGVAQAVALLPSKHEAQSSNPSTMKK
jgi:hypothetical protein